MATYFQIERIPIHPAIGPNDITRQSPLTGRILRKRATMQAQQSYRDDTHSEKCWSVGRRSRAMAIGQVAILLVFVECDIRIRRFFAGHRIFADKVKSLDVLELFCIVTKP